MTTMNRVIRAAEDAWDLSGTASMQVAAEDEDSVLDFDGDYIAVTSSSQSPSPSDSDIALR
ncbi:hypothetical protein N7471_001010 [Penicillium samsonianum]|uniref:uncharacterized protein n=1 Tax=Penicillium samsonianum TaxID=1882272 RepID=UPI002547D0FB|nr:uncharacterized protein N7471_001010 [Penicillium samsonianum]KAJ6149811.1 hypothetical protein N7471_001010 [Penicillium samsonianum]